MWTCMKSAYNILAQKHMSNDCGTDVGQEKKTQMNPALCDLQLVLTDFW